MQILYLIKTKPDETLEKLIAAQRITHEVEGKLAVVKVFHATWGTGYTESNSEEMIEFVLLNASRSTSWTVPVQQTVRKCESELGGVLPDRKSELGQWLRVDQQYAQRYITE